MAHKARSKARSRQNIKHLGFRVSPEFWSRLNDAAWREKMSLQEFCVSVLERYVGRSEKKAADDVNGTSVRSRLPEIKNKKTTPQEES